MTEDKLPLTSQDVLMDRIAALSELFPGFFVEGKVDFEPTGCLRQKIILLRKETKERQNQILSTCK